MKAELRRIVALTCLLGSAAVPALAADQAVVVDGGAVKLGLTSPAPHDLSSGASLALQLPAGSMTAQATTSVGKEGLNTAFWQKNAAKVEAKMAGPLGTSVAVSGEDVFGFTYRAPASIGPTDTSGHMIRSESRSATASMSLPVGPAALTVGAEGTDTGTQDTEKAQPTGPGALVRTQDRALFAKGEWQPLSGVEIEGGAAAHKSDISWRQQLTHSASFQSLDPYLSARVTPSPETTLSARVEQKVQPYDAAAFSGYAAANLSAAAFQPDHDWQLEAQLDQKIGVADLTVRYTGARDGTVMEFADQDGIQIPVSARLDKREEVAVGLRLPLTGFGLSDTVLSSQAEWRRSQVVDPLTQNLRTASGEAPSKFTLRMEHALTGRNLCIGLTGDVVGPRTSYQVNETSTTGSAGTLGAFLSYKPGPYEIDFNVNGLYGGSNENTFYEGSRATSPINHVTVQDNSGALFNLSLHKAL